jgi:hypothetical protein
MDVVSVKQGSFLEITREERFFCSLLTHALLTSSTMREGLFARLRDVTQIDLDPRQGATEIYSEVAWLRDHWRNLGDPQQWSPDLEDARKGFLADCLAALGRRLDDIAEQPFFRTTGAHPKVVSPGRWPIAALARDSALRDLKWAFNAKPDFILVCGDRALIIEAKVESGPGKTASGYSQDSTQDVLSRLLPAVSPYLDREQVGRAWLAREAIDSHSPTVTWAEIAGLVARTRADDLDEFSRRGLMRFADRAAARGPGASHD